MGTSIVNREAPCFLADDLVVICEGSGGVQALHSDTENRPMVKPIWTLY